MQALKILADLPTLPGRTGFSLEGHPVDHLVLGAMNIDGAGVDKFRRNPGIGITGQMRHGPGGSGIEGGHRKGNCQQPSQQHREIPAGLTAGFKDMTQHDL